MQVMVLAAQNAAAYADLGVATSVGHLLRRSAHRWDVAIVAVCWSAALSWIVPGAADALATRMPLVIGLMAPLLGLAFLLLLALPAVPLRENRLCSGGTMSQFLVSASSDARTSRWPAAKGPTSVS
jgi:hypothetical protein